MQVAPCSGDCGVPERGLHKMDGRAAVEAMTAVGVPKPMRRDRLRQARPRRYRLRDPVDDPKLSRSQKVGSEFVSETDSYRYLFWRACGVSSSQPAAQREMSDAAA